MTTLALNITLDNGCNLSVSDTTGFYNGSTNLTGFLPESNESSLVLNTYKLSQGYFLNILLYNKYASTPVIVNTSDSFYTVPQPTNVTYANNFPSTSYKLTLDGSYTLTRYFIPSLTFYTANYTNSIFNSINMFYTDGTNLYNVISGTPTIISITAFINTNLNTSNCISTSSSFISTCHTNACYFKILSTITDKNIGVPQHHRDYGQDRRDYGDTYYDSYRDSRSEDDRRYEFKELKEKRDILYMTLEVIKYLQDFNNITQIQKLIEALDICGTMCSPIIGANCGCSG